MLLQFYVYKGARQMQHCGFVSQGGKGVNPLNLQLPNCQNFACKGEGGGGKKQMSFAVTKQLIMRPCQ